MDALACIDAIGSISVRFDELMEAAAEARKCAAEAKDYAEEIGRKVTRKIPTLPGKDLSGGATSAAGRAAEKISQLSLHAGSVEQLGVKLETFSASAREHDDRAANLIRQTAAKYVPSRNLFQKCGDALYGLFVSVGDRSDALNHVTSIMRYASTDRREARKDVVYWGTYGEGQYWVDILESVAGIVLVIGGIAAAIAALPAVAGAALVVGAIGALAALVGGGIAIDYKLTEIEYDGKAIAEHKKGNTSVAYYYGQIDDGVSEAQRVDFGDAADNAAQQEHAEKVDRTKKVADVVAATCKLANTTAGVKDMRQTTANAAGERVTNLNYKKVTSYDFSLANVKTNVLDSMGYKTMEGSWAWNENNRAWSAKDMFHPDFGTGKFAATGEYVGKTANTIFKASAVADTAFGLNKDIDLMKDNFQTLRDGSSAGSYSAVEFHETYRDYATGVTGVFDVLPVTGFVNKYTSPAEKIIDGVEAFAR